MTTKRLAPVTPLERHVTRWANAEAANYDNKLEGVFKDLFYGGCSSGVVGHLIYYKDTLPFFRKHRREIETILKELCDDSGCSIAQLLKDWDKSDPFCRQTQNQNLLAWFGFEEAARRLADRAGIE